MLSNLSDINEDSLATIADEFGTPLVVYSEQTLRSNAESLMDALPEGARLAYSIKANPNPYLLRTFRKLGLLAEAASQGEFCHAVQHGFHASEVLLGGPGMPRSALRAAGEAGARAVLLESRSAVIRASQLGLSGIPILLRVNPNNLQSNVQTRMTGIPSPFGIDEPDLPAAILETKRLGLDYAGLFQYVGTQAAGAGAIAANTFHLLALDEKVTAAGLPPARILNFGGGFPVPETPDQPSLDLTSLRRELEQIGLPQKMESAEILFESGRFLVNNGGVLLTRVLDSKVSFGKIFTILDTGLNALGLRQLKYRKWQPELVPISQKNGEARLTTFVGPTCTPIDVVAEDVPMPPQKEGDLICIPRFGAYSVSFSPTMFCGYGHPGEVAFLCDGTTCVLRQRAAYPVGCYLENH